MTAVATALKCNSSMELFHSAMLKHAFLLLRTLPTIVMPNPQQSKNLSYSRGKLAFLSFSLSLFVFLSLSPSLFEASMSVVLTLTSSCGDSRVLALKCTRTARSQTVLSEYILSRKEDSKMAKKDIR